MGLSNSANLGRPLPAVSGSGATSNPAQWWPPHPGGEPPQAADDEPDWFNLEIWGKQAQVGPADYVSVKLPARTSIGSFKLDRWTDRSSGEGTLQAGGAGFDAGLELLSLPSGDFRYQGAYGDGGPVEMDRAYQGEPSDAKEVPF